MKILLVLFFLTVFNIFAQSEDMNESDSVYYSNLFKNKTLPGYYFYIPVKNNDTVFQSIITYQALKFMMGKIGSVKKDKEFKEIVCNALLNKDTILLNESYQHSFDQFIIPVKFKKFTDSIASFGQEYFLSYFFNTTDYEGINQYRGVIKSDIYPNSSNLSKVQFQNAVVYHLIKWKLYVFHQGYTGNLVFNKEENFEKLNGKINESK